MIVQYYTLEATEMEGRSGELRRAATKNRARRAKAIRAKLARENPVE